MLKVKVEFRKKDCFSKREMVNQFMLILKSFLSHSFHSVKIRIIGYTVKKNLGRLKNQGDSNLM